MKNLIKILVVFFITITIVGCGSTNNEATPAQIQKKIDVKDTFITTVTSTTCGACQAYKPIVEEFTKKYKDVDLKDVVIDKLENNDEKINFLHKYAITSTPTTLFFKDGKLVTMVSGLIPEEKLESLYNEYLK